jgi:hypothetical protein
LKPATPAVEAKEKEELITSLKSGTFHFALTDTSYFAYPGLPAWQAKKDTRGLPYEASCVVQVVIIIFP